jgi:urease accessory protein
MGGGFLAGFAHPFSGPDHLLAMVAVGLWGAFLGRPLITLFPVIFPCVMTFGAILGMVNTPMPPIELGIALSVLVLGIAVACAWRAPVWLAVIAVGVFAVLHGYAHGRELPSMVDPVAFSLGFVFATGSLHVIGIAIGSCARTTQGAVTVRVSGAAIALAGGYYLASSLGVAA